MAQADSHNTTSAPVDPTRRRFLALVGGSAAAAATVSQGPAIAASSKALDTSKVGPALRDAVIALRESHDALEAAKAGTDAAEAKVARWEEENPEPTSKRGKKRYWRKWAEYHREASDRAWFVQRDAENHFKAAQGRLAKMHPANQDELCLMAAAAAIYDAVKLSYGQTAIISYGFVLGYFRLTMPTPGGMI